MGPKYRKSIQCLLDLQAFCIKTARRYFLVHLKIVIGKKAERSIALEEKGLRSFHRAAKYVAPCSHCTVRGPGLVEHRLII